MPRYEDEYQLEDLDITPASYIKATSVANFRKSWEELDAGTEREDDYGLGTRDSLQVCPSRCKSCLRLPLVQPLIPELVPLQDAVEAVIGILGMQPCEGTDAVPPNSRSHTVLLSGTFVGYKQVLVRMSFGIDAGRTVAMKLCVRSESENVSDAIHQIIQDA